MLLFISRDLSMILGVGETFTQGVMDALGEGFQPSPMVVAILLRFWFVMCSLG